MSVIKVNTHSADSLHLSDLRIVMLGSRWAGKSSSGNTILGRKEFDLRTSAQCVKRQGEVAGRQVTVVDTPGWWENYPIEKTPELIKQEIMLSVSLCPPGPHTLLLVIRVDRSFTEEHRRSIEEHLGLLSELVWSHTIVLFTWGDSLGDTTIEQHIESEGKDLQWLVEKCGNRYHVLNNKNRGDGTQVTELLEKIEEMVAGNRGGHYEMNREILEKIEVMKRKKVERADERTKTTSNLREIQQTFIDKSLKLLPLRIVLLGSRWAGKSSSGNTILGREEFIMRTSAQCVKRQGEVAGRQVTVVDTPGWWENYPIEMTPELIKQEIMLSVSLCSPGPHILLLVLQVDTSFTERHRRSIEEHLGLLSELVWSHTIVLFTRGDCLGDTTIEQHIEGEGKDLQWLVEKCGNRYHVLNNKNRVDGTQVTELLEKIEEMVAGNSGDYFVIYPKMGKEKINFGPEEPPTPLEDTDHHLASRMGLDELWKKPSLPIKGARSIELPPPSMSGDSRPETAYDEQMSEGGTRVKNIIKGMDELWKRPSLPIKGARSIELPPPSMSEDTIPESGYDEEPISECGTLVESKMKGIVEYT
uniref:AIG1-type G domain-containing protein n=1 Tax=Esox lucius TaxID=8010 RepID=A0A6Q2XG10_ESOLU